MKKAMSLFLSWTFILFIGLSAFAQAEGSANLCCETPVAYTMAVCVGTGNGNPNESIWFDYLEKETNVHIDFNVIPEEIRQEQTNLLLIASDMPDAFATGLIDQNTANQLGLEGLLLPLDELIEMHAPHIMQLFEEQPIVRAQVTAGDGHIYSIPKVDAIASAYQTVATEMFINVDYLDKVGMDIPTTTEELYEVLKAFARTDLDGDGDPTNEIPLGFHYPTYDFGCMLMGAYGVVNSVDWMYFDYDAPTGENFSKMATTDGYKAWLGYMHRLYSEQLIDQDVFVQDNATYMSKAAAFTYGAFVGWGGWNEVLLENLTDGSSEYTGKYHVVPVLAGPDGICMAKYNFNGGLVTGSLSITEACADPVPLIKWVDKFYDQESDWNIQMLYGPVGFNLEIDQNGVYQYLPTPEGIAYTNFRWTHTFNTMPLWTGERTAQKLVFNPNQTWKAKIDQDFGYVEAASTNKPAPSLSFTEDEQAELAVIQTDINNYIKQYRAQAIAGEVDLHKTWDEYVANVDRLQMDRVVDIYNAAYVRLVELL